MKNFFKKTLNWLKKRSHTQKPIIFIFVILTFIGTYTGRKGGFSPIYNKKTGQIWGIDVGLLNQFTENSTFYGISLSAVSILNSGTSFNGINASLLNGGPSEKFSKKPFQRGINLSFLTLYFPDSPLITQGVSLNLISSVETIKGVQASGIVSIANEGSSGGQFSPGINISFGEMFQVSSLFNYGEKNCAQLSCLANVGGDSSAQFSPINFAGKNSVQVGIFNKAKSGLQIGLINVLKNENSTSTTLLINWGGIKSKEWVTMTYSLLIVLASGASFLFLLLAVFLLSKNPTQNKGEENEEK